MIGLAAFFSDRFDYIRPYRFDYIRSDPFEYVKPEEKKFKSKKNSSKDIDDEILFSILLLR
jgi:hypothetical protein